VDIIEQRPEFCHVEPRRSAAVDAEITAGDLTVKRADRSTGKVP